MKIPKNIFLDRDGTLIEDKHYLSNPDHIVLFPGVGDALYTLTNIGCKLFLVSNQSGVGRGFFSESSVCACQNKLNALLAAYNVRFTDVRWCLHAPGVHCNCRKPNIGMWMDLSKHYGLAASETIIIGDKLDDIGFGVHAEFMAAFLIKTGKGEQQGHKAGYCFPTGKSRICEVAQEGQTAVMTSCCIQDIVSWITQK